MIDRREIIEPTEAERELAAASCACRLRAQRRRRAEELSLGWHVEQRLRSRLGNR
jgi:hypothetical protein